MNISIRPKPLISVIICTYNRADLLSICLEYLTQQTLDKQYYEIIVVDNNSSDDTPNVVKNFMKQHTTLSYTYEPKQGLSHARNRGWREAKGEYVAYIDDETKTSPAWLINAKRIIETQKPHVFGGAYGADYDKPPPKWIKKEYFSTIKQWGEKPRRAQRNEYFSGQNIFIKRSLLEKLCGFDPKFGMKGKKQAFGEETILQIQIREKNSEINFYFDPSLNVKHLVRREKFNLVGSVPYHFTAGRYSSRVFLKPLSINAFILLPFLFTKLILHIILLISGLLIAPVLRNRKRYPYLQNFIFEKSLFHIRQIGAQYERLLEKTRLLFLSSFKFKKLKIQKNCGK